MRLKLATGSLAAPVWAATLSAAAGTVTVYRVETVAGTDDPGDGGPAIAAQLGAIQGIAVDRAGNVYISDTDNHRIRKVTPQASSPPLRAPESRGTAAMRGRPRRHSSICPTA